MDFYEINFVELVFRQLFENFTMTWFTEPTPKDFEHVLREIEFHNSGSAAAL